MSLSYRHKQTAIIFIVCILGVGVAGYAAYGPALWQNTAKNNATDSVVTASATKTDTENSSDEWKEQFLTQTVNGTPTQSATTKVSVEPIEPETLTGQFGKKFFEQYMFLKQSNLTENPEAVQAVIDQSVGNVVNAAPLPRVYDIREMNISTKLIGESYERAYINSVGALFSAYMPKQDAATVALQALENEDKTRVKEIEAIATAHETILKQMLAITAPSSLATYHVNLVNAVSSLSFSSRGLTNIFADPLQSIPALAVYEKTIGQLRNALLDLRFFSTQHDIQFASTEPATIIFSMTN